MDILKFEANVSNTMEIYYKNESRINRAITREDNLLRISGSTFTEMPGNTGRSS